MTRKPIDSAALEKVVGGAYLPGTDGHDTTIGTNEADSIVLGAGNDYAEGRGGNDYIDAGAGHDEVYGDAGDDAIFAGAGNDFAAGGAGNDYIEGNDGDDVILGEAGTDALTGGAGNDIVVGGDGADNLQGDAGDDTLIGGFSDRAADSAFGGEGNDTFSWSPGGGNDYFDGGNGRDALTISGMTMAQLQQGLQVYTPGLQLLENSAGGVSFVNSQGQPQSFSGQLTIGGETLRFDNVERLQVG
ncbi:calcium-binding protein [Pararoseomonas indoligenes]|uniref:Calcium-binding protein n=1 Tax=Roseomonas indoligenes TaxID=2820811 RepID=A0A940MYT8_9PROT|nr:calcium-binding protein [Pararoseomonas indoligenes]MBP0494153.1 hypothetical protein [Pararoseomonas indoligenes]